MDRHGDSNIFMRMYGSRRCRRWWKPWQRCALMPALAAMRSVCGGCWVLARRRRRWRQPQPVVAPGVWMVQGESALGSPANRNFISNAAFVVTPDGVVVIDALGSPALARNCSRPSPHHAAAGAARHRHALPRRPHLRPAGLQGLGAEIIAHAGRPYLHSDTARCACRPAARNWRPGSTRTRGWCRPTAGSTPRALHARRRRVPAAAGRPGAHAGRPGGLRCRARACCSPATWSSAAASPSSARPTAGAGSRRWTGCSASTPQLIVPGHGPVSTHRAGRPEAHARLPRTCADHGRGGAQPRALRGGLPKADWSRFEHLPLFRAANRINAYNTYLLMEQAPNEAPPAMLGPGRGRCSRRWLAAGPAAPHAPRRGRAGGAGPPSRCWTASRWARRSGGRAAVVVFWSTTCPFCRRHNQHVEKLHRPPPAPAPLAVLGVARDRDAEAVRRHAAHGYTFRHHHGAGAAGGGAGPRAT
jgi:hypothetical protein